MSSAAAVATAGGPRPGGRQPYLPLLGGGGVNSGDSNPFINRTFHGRPPWAKRISRWVVSVTLLPLRAVLMVAIVACLFVIAQVATLGLRRADYHPLSGRPLASWRAALFESVYFGARLTLALLGFRIRCKGRCAPRSEAPIIVANHVTGIVEGLYFMRHAKVVEGSYMNAFLKLMVLGSSGIIVDRSDPGSRQVTKEALLRRCREGRWPQTLVFAEGTTTNGTALLQFKPGAFLPGRPVQPVLFRYRFRHHDPSFTFPHSTLSFVLGLCREVVHDMEVEYLPVYRPSAAEARDPALFAAGVQRAMAEALGVPTARFGAEDVILGAAAMRLGMPPEAAMVQWPRVSEGFADLRVRDALGALRRFRALDRAGAGRIDAATFADSMQRLAGGALPAQQQFLPEDLRGIFDLLDARGDGYLDFQEYLCGVALLSGRGQQQEAEGFKWTFDCLSHGQPHISLARMQAIIARAKPGITGDHLQQLTKGADRDADGCISRDEFISFAKDHREDLCLDAERFFSGLPLLMDAMPAV